MSTDTSSPGSSSQSHNIGINIRPEFGEMQINGQTVYLNQSNRASLSFEGSTGEVETALEELLANVPEAWKKLRTATDLVTSSPLVDEFGESGAEPRFVLAVSVRQILTRHDEVPQKDEDYEVADDIQPEQG